MIRLSGAPRPEADKEMVTARSFVDLKFVRAALSKALYQPLRSPIAGSIGISTRQINDLYPDRRASMGSRCSAGAHWLFTSASASRYSTPPISTSIAMSSFESLSITSSIQPARLAIASSSPQSLRCRSSKAARCPNCSLRWCMPSLCAKRQACKRSTVLAFIPTKRRASHSV